MADWVLGLLAIAIGALFCFRGFVSMRIVFAVWGALAGFGFGAGLVSAIAGDGFLATGTGWIVGLVLAVIVSALAYVFYAVSVLLAMSSIGYVLGATALVAVGVEWNWLVALAGIAGGILLAVLALRFNLPATILIVLTASAGAGTVVAGLMLLTGTLETDDLDRATVTEKLSESPAWWILYAVLAIVGIVAQVAAMGRERASQDAWAHRTTTGDAPPQPQPQG